MKEKVFFYGDGWPAQIDIPKTGIIKIFGSGGFGGISGPRFELDLDLLTEEQHVTLQKLLDDYLKTDLSKHGVFMDAMSHILTVQGQFSLTASRIFIDRFDSPHCPLPIRNMYSFIQDPENFEPLVENQPGSAPSGFDGGP